LAFLSVLVLRILLMVSLVKGLLLVFRSRLILFLIYLLKLSIYVFAIMTSSVVHLAVLFNFELFILRFDLLKHQIYLLIYRFKSRFVKLSDSNQSN